MDNLLVAGPQAECDRIHVPNEDLGSQIQADEMVCTAIGREQQVAVARQLSRSIGVVEASVTEHAGCPGWCSAFIHHGNPFVL